MQHTLITLPAAARLEGAAQADGDRLVDLDQARVYTGDIGPFLPMD